MQSKRYQFKNQFNSFTSVFIYAGPDTENFFVEVTVRQKNEDGTQKMQVNTKQMPNEKYNDFIQDLNNRSVNNLQAK